MKYTLAALCILVAFWIQSGCAKVNVFEEPPNYPVIDSIFPATGIVGTQLRLYGSGFSTILSQDTASINGVPVRVDASTSITMLVTVIDSTGTGHVNVKVNGQAAEGPIFTYGGGGIHPGAPVITKGDHGWYDGTGYSLNVTTLPASNSSIKVTIGGVEVPFDQVTRPGEPAYDPNEGMQILFKDGSKVEDQATQNFANCIVYYDGVASNLYPLQLIPNIKDMFSRNGEYRFVQGDTLTIQGRFFGDRTLPSSFDMLYNNQQLTQPTVLSWTNTEIRAIMPAYPEVPVSTGMNIGLIVGPKRSYSYGLLYLGAVTGKVFLVAGNDEGSSNGHGSAARFNTPMGLAVYGSTLYVADKLNNRIQMITNISASGGDVTTLAGQYLGFLDGTTSAAMFYYPMGVAVDEAGVVYVADMLNNRIRAISGGTVSTVSGNGNPSTFWYPTSVATINHNQIYVADMNNNRIQLLFNFTLFTFAGGAFGFQDGTGTAAKFENPYGVAVGTDGTIYVADALNHAIRKITAAGVVTTLAGGQRGSTDGIGTEAKFDNPTALAVDAQNNVYVADANTSHIRKINSQGVVTSLTGLFADGSGVAIFASPSGIAVDGSGTLYISDAGAHRIYKMVP